MTLMPFMSYFESATKLRIILHTAKKKYTFSLRGAKGNLGNLEWLCSNGSKDLRVGCYGMSDGTQKGARADYFSR